MSFVVERRDYANARKRVSHIRKLIDAEMALKLAIDAELIPKEKFENASLHEMSDDVLFECLKSIIKDRLDKTLVRRNQDGISVSIGTDSMTTLFAFTNEANRFLRDNEEYMDLFNKVRRPNRELDFFRRGDLIQVKSDRIVFYLKFSQLNYYQSMLSFSALFEMFFYLEELERLAEEVVPRLRQSYEEEMVRVREEEQRRQEEERRVRERMEAEERRRRDEMDRREGLLSSGATEGGIEIANRLNQFLRQSRQTNE